MSISKRRSGALAATQQTPVDHIGKVFFTLDGSNYVCSGNAIASSNESTVATAGHCLNSGPGAFASRFIFVPAYENAAAPFGQCNATELYAPTQWTTRGDITYDTGFAIVSSNSGATLSDTVGASGIAVHPLRHDRWGSSGGPWFIGSGSSDYSNDPNTMFGPYWGSVIANVYDAAAA